MLIIFNNLIGGGTEAIIKILNICTTKVFGSVFKLIAKKEPGKPNATE
jgi:hypothetical protein